MNEPKAVRTAAQALAQQRADHAKPATKPTTTAIVPAPTTAVAPINAEDARRAYLDEVAPSSIAGRLIKFSKDGKFVFADDDEGVSPDEDFVALCDETLVGYIKFNSDAPPDREMGLLYQGFIPPRRETLGDTDETKWEPGLSGQPTDPWRNQMCLVLQNVATRELATFTTSSVTGRRAVGNLLRHFDRMRRAGPNEYPIVRLRPGGFNHKDPRVGWVPVPAFAIFGKAPRDESVTPDTSVSGSLNDDLPPGLR